MLIIAGVWTAPADPADVEAFERDYAERHVPLATRLPGLRRLTTVLVTDGYQGAAPTDYRLVMALFDDRAAYDAAVASPEYAAMRADRQRLIDRYGVDNRAQVGEALDVDLAGTG